MNALHWLHVAIWFALTALPVPNIPGPTLTGKCQFGDMLQTGRNLAITGGSWTATGEIRKDGTVLLYWDLQGRQAIGVYFRNAKSLDGVWSWSDACHLNEAGDIEGGEIHAESFWR